MAMTYLREPPEAPEDWTKFWKALGFALSLVSCILLFVMVMIHIYTS